MIKRCIGCGAILQNEDENKIGYTPKKIVHEEVYCKRCFRLKNYNELPKIVASKEDYERVVDDILNKNGLVVLLVDLFDFTGSFIPQIINRLRPKNVILVANKYDLLPKSTNISKIVKWLEYMCNRVFFKVDAIHIVSASKGYYLDDLMTTIDMLRQERDVYFVGCANVGKSSLINAILKRFTPKTTNLIATSIIPGTTIDSITIPFFEDNKALIDTPGLINEGTVLNHLSPKSYEKILPNKEIKPITYQILEDNSVFVGGLACISLIRGKDISFTCYFSDKLNIHRTKTSRVSDLFQTAVGGLLTPPALEEKELITYSEYDFNIKGKHKQDLVLSGLGFITLSDNCEIHVKAVLGMDVFLRNAIIGTKD